MTGTLEEILEELCEEVSLILASSSLEEALVNKPGNASRRKDIRSVTYISVQQSSLYLSSIYKKACVMGYAGRGKPIFSLLDPARFSSIFGRGFALFGTAITLLPVSFAAIQVSSIDELMGKLKSLVLLLDEKEGEAFILSLRSMNPSYKGRLTGDMDIGSIEGKTLREILLYSSNFDEVARNIVHGYYLTYLGYNAIKEQKCDSFELNVRRAFFKVLSSQPDTLIMKKYGAHVSIEISKWHLI